MGTCLVDRVCTYNKAISEPQRMKMIKILGSSQENTVCVSDIGNILGISQPAATRHLKILYDADLVTKKRINSCVFYSLNIKAIKDYQKLMAHAFEKAFSPCLYEFNCDECPFGETCN